MQDRHSNREKYFSEQAQVTEKYVIPYIEQIIQISEKTNVAEIGCGEGGNLMPFLDRGCKVTGIDIDGAKIANANLFFAEHPNIGKATFIAEDIYKIPRDGKIEGFDVIILRDTIEHIPNQKLFLGFLKEFLAPEGCIFIAFPPWRMPFGGHQQMCKSKFLCKLPYFHLLPRKIYVGILKLFGENSGGLEEIADTGISIQRLKKILKEKDYSIEKEDYFLINPNYEIKFGLKPRIVPSIINIPYLRDTYTSAYYCIVK